MVFFVPVCLAEVVALGALEHGSGGDASGNAEQLVII